jgi:hypothetical protein
MTKSMVNRGHFNHASLVSLLAAAAATALNDTTCAQQASVAPTRRDVIRQEIPGEPQRDLSLVEVTYPPGTGSPRIFTPTASWHSSFLGPSKVGDGPEQIFHAGDAWWEPPGAIRRVSRNASSTEPATLLAIYVAPRGSVATDLMKPI